MSICVCVCARALQSRPCMVFTYALLIVPTLFFAAYVLPTLSPIPNLLACGVILATVGSFSVVSMKDPGVVPRKGDVEDQEGHAPPAAAATLGPGTHYCRHCRISVPASVSHCDECEVCIAGCVNGHAPAARRV